MKNTLLFILFSLMSCGDKPEAAAISASEITVQPQYDTVAIDSFSPGATSVDVSRRIQISSQKYQDSLKKMTVKLEEEKLLNKLKAEKDKAAKAELEKKKNAGEKAASEKLPTVKSGHENGVQP